jgi:hypothetical protein
VGAAVLEVLGDRGSFPVRVDDPVDWAWTDLALGWS